MDIDRVVGCRSDQLSLGGATLFTELLFGPAAGDDDPLPCGLAAGGASQASQCFVDAGSAYPVDLGAESLTGAYAVKMRVDHAWDDSAAAQIDDSRAAAGKSADLCGGPCRYDLAIAHRERLAHTVVRVLRQDLAVGE